MKELPKNVETFLQKFVELANSFYLVIDINNNIIPQNPEICAEYMRQKRNINDFVAQNFSDIKCERDLNDFFKNYDYRLLVGNEVFKHGYCLMKKEGQIGNLVLCNTEDKRLTIEPYTNTRGKTNFCEFRCGNEELLNITAMLRRPIN